MRRASQTRRTMRASHAIGSAFAPEVHAGGPRGVWWGHNRPFGLKHFCPAQVSISRPSIVKCSWDNRRSRFFLTMVTFSTEAPDRGRHTSGTAGCTAASVKSCSFRRRSSTGNNRHYKKAPKIVKWQYCDPSRRISAQLIGTGQWCLQQYSCIKKQDPWGVWMVL